MEFKFALEQVIGQSPQQLQIYYTESFFEEKRAWNSIEFVLPCVAVFAECSFGPSQSIRLDD